uniref:Uncharacterized protein n=1 Tax=viral metagenome TaxID=1070528 RepID=A0A6C0J847_9ZZZZ
MNFAGQTNQNFFEKTCVLCKIFHSLEQAKTYKLF